MTRLFLVRHGETTSNVMRRLDTALPGAALTDFGVRQAARFALGNDGVLNDRMLNDSGSARPALISSVARRAQQTAEVVGGLWGIDSEVVDGLHEVQVGDLEDRNDREAYETFGSVVERWHHGETSVALPGGESLDDVFARYLPAVDEIARRYLRGPQGRDVYVVSHGAAIRLIAARLADVDPGFAVGNHLANTGVVELGYAPEGDSAEGDSAEGDPTAGGNPWSVHRWGDRVAPFVHDDAEGDPDRMG